MKRNICSTLFLVLAATCHAQTYVNHFDTPPALGGADQGLNSLSGYWYIDRSAPATFTNTIFQGVTALDVGINAADYNSGNSWYNWQGRKSYLTGTGSVSSVSAQLYIPSQWADIGVFPSMWLTTSDNSGNNAGFPIISFYSPSTGMATDCGLYVNGTGGWVQADTPIDWNDWNTFTISLANGEINYSINGQSVYAYAVSSAARISNVMFENYNDGTANYDAYWSDLTTPSPTVNPTATPEPALLSLLALGGTLFLGLKKLRRPVKTS